MAETGSRRDRLVQGLAEDPGDPFLRYALAMDYLRAGEVEEGRRRLRDLIADRPGDQEVPAYQQLGQSHLDAGEREEARAMFRAGIARAQAKGDAHAAAEMDGLLALLDG